MKLYEAMFIVNNNAAKENYEKVEAEALGCITRHGGEIVNTIKWDERRLTYEINKQKRGTFILCHFNAPHDAIGKIEKQCRLSEVILRVLIVVDTDGPEAKVAPSSHEDLGAEHRPGRDSGRYQKVRPEVAAASIEDLDDAGLSET
ncbi:MAG: 30S ribosomal protein S6 [Planctomycetes bacterium]|nr:30S ribosomal protein S6 [Planctomycetota bacterium]